MTIDIKRGLATVASFKAGEDTVFVQKLMGEHKITTTLQVAEVMDVQIGDYIEYDGEVFTINNMPEITRLGERILEYEITFEGEIYRLYNKIMMDEGAADFGYFGTPEDYLLLLLSNINEIDPGWTLGTVVQGIEPKSTSFQNVSCREALSRIAELFELEYVVYGQQINMVPKVGQDIFLNLQYGKGNGLYQLERLRLNDKGVITRLYAFGGRKNIDIDYRGGESRLIFDGNPLESNVATYGVVEGSISFDDIFPQRTGSVTDLPASGDIFSIFDNTIDFDINAQLLEGTTAKIVFKSGDLAGYEFEITAYDHVTKKITFKEFVEENDYKLPNDVVKAGLGDEYTLVDIKMPQSYIDTAEADLQAKAQEYLDEHDHPRVTYAFNCDEIFFKQNNINIRIGDRIGVSDAGLGINTTLRISEVSFPLLYPKRITAAISEGVEYTTTEQIIRVTAQTLEQIRTVNQTSNEQARLSQLRLRELQGLIYDPDGYFDTENIKPSSIETIHLAVGVKSQQFALSGVVFSPNQNAIPASFGWSGGELIHYEIEENLRTWQIAQGSIGSLLDANAYYIYARVPIVGNQGGIVLDTAARKVDHEAGFYTLLIGVLHSVIDGVRGISLTYGTTEINGKFIRTGTIFSQDGQTYFDLDAGVIGGKIQFEAGSSGYNNLADIPGANPYFEQGTRLWSYDYEGENVAENITDIIANSGNWGGKALQIEGAKRIFYSNVIPVDINRRYKGRLKVRQTVDSTNGDNLVYGRLLCLDTNYNRVLDGGGFWNNFIVNGQQINSNNGWITFEGEIFGVGNGENEFKSTTKYVRLGFFVNAPSGDGIAQVDGLEFFDITESDEAENNSKAYTDALQNALGGLAYDDLVALAKLDSTIIEGGYIKTSLIDVNTLIVSGGIETEQGSTDKANDAQSAAESYADGKVSNLQSALGNIAYEDLVGLAVLDDTIIQGGYIKTTLIDVNTLIVSGGIETEQGATDKADAAQSAAEAYAENQVGTLENLVAINNPYFEKGLRFWTTQYNGENPPENVNYPIVTSGSWGGKVIQIQGTDNIYFVKPIPVNRNKKYKLRLRIRQLANSSDGQNMHIFGRLYCMGSQYEDLGGALFTNIINENIEVADGWLELEAEITGEGTGTYQFKSGTSYVRVGVRVNHDGGNGTVEIDGLEFYDITETKELENSLGNLAYDDLVGLAKLDTTVIQGGYIKTSLIDVDTLIARNVLTSPIGRRVHIDGANNRMRFYNASGTLKLEVDENSGTDPDGNNLTGLICYEGIRTSQVTNNGIVSDNPRIQRSGLHASIFGLAPFKSLGSSITAGIIGFNNSSNRSSVFGGYFNSLYAPDFGMNLQLGGQSSSSSINLPSDPFPGELRSYRSQSPNYTINGNGHNIVLSSGSIVTSFLLSGHKGVIIQFSSGLWWIIAEN